MDLETSALLLAWAAIVVLAFALSGLLRQVHALRIQVVGPIAEHLGPKRGTRVHAIGALTQGESRMQVLMFADTSCRACERLMPEFTRLAASAASTADFKVLLPGDKNGLVAPELEVLDHQGDVFLRFEIPATPFGVLIDAEGVVQDARPLGSVEILRSFVAQESEGA